MSALCSSLIAAVLFSGMFFLRRLPYCLDKCPVNGSDYASFVRPGASYFDRTQ